MDSLENRESYKDPVIISVDMFEWKVVKNPAIAETTGLGPCFGVIIYDPVSKKAIIGHFPAPHLVSHDLEKMLTAAKRHFKNSQEVKVYIGGGAPDPDHDPDFRNVKAARKFVEEQLQKNGFRNPQTEYHDSNNSTILRIDTRTGLINYDTTDFWEDDGDI